MPEQQPEKGRRVTLGVAAAAAAAAVLAVIGILALVLGLHGTPGPSHSVTGQGLAASATHTGTAAATDGQSPKPAENTSGPSSRPRPPATPAAETHTDTSGGPIGQFLPASDPTSLQIPSIGVQSTHFVPLSIQPDGTISVPGTAQEVGLYNAGPTPGQLGPAVLAAHVDTPAGVPGIFAKLREVKAGDPIKITREDGTRLTFTVDRVAAYRKTQFPTQLVYDGNFTQAEIRLVTCGGPTDNRNEYRDNVIVFAHLTSAT
ncbi:class F sortase [Terrabacter carboxydivorans]|uniref:Sortase family protein n=1 Tax=Terrabacter carboxydivorans TaxID=619730 RepID=A0ABP5ZSJ6_9MICO